MGQRHQVKKKIEANLCSLKHEASPSHAKTKKEKEKTTAL